MIVEKTVTQIKKVLVVESTCLLDASMESLLSVRNDLQVCAVAYQSVDCLLFEISQFHPDVIIIDDKLLQEVISALLFELLKYPNLRLIGANPENNRLHIYEKKQVLMEESTDFLAVV